MSLLRDYDELLKLERARTQPYLPLMPYSVIDTLESIRLNLFPDITKPVHIHFVNRGPLACIGERESSATIYIHQILNHSETPFEVISMVCKHELLHLRIPPAVVGKRTTGHPPEFWEAERTISPERRQGWCWIWINYGLNIKKRPRLERIDVLPGWRKTWSRSKLDLPACQRLVSGKPEGTEEPVW